MHIEITLFFVVLNGKSSELTDKASRSGDSRHTGTIEASGGSGVHSTSPPIAAGVGITRTFGDCRQTKQNK